MGQVASYTDNAKIAGLRVPLVWGNRHCKAAWVMVSAWDVTPFKAAPTHARGVCIGTVSQSYRPYAVVLSILQEASCSDHDVASEILGVLISCG